MKHSKGSHCSTISEKNNNLLDKLPVKQTDQLTTAAPGGVNQCPVGGGSGPRCRAALGHVWPAPSKQTNKQTQTKNKQTNGRSEGATAN